MNIWELYFVIIIIIIIVISFFIHSLIAVVWRIKVYILTYDYYRTCIHNELA